MLPEHQKRERFLAYTATLRERLTRGLLTELQPFHQWVMWRREHSNGQEKKVPYTPHNGSHASVNTPHTWGSLLEALKALESGRFSGIGFMLSETDPYCVVDIDHAYERKTHAITSPTGVHVVSLLSSYTEASPNDGLHVLVQATLPGKGLHTAIEMYDRGRFFTVTTRHLPYTPASIEHRQGEIEQLYEAYKPIPAPRRSESTRVGGGGRRREAAAPPARTDEEVLRLALYARNGEQFLELWSGAWQGNPRYTSQGRPDDSRADWQLVKYLLYWTGNDPHQTDRLFRQSRLMRDKWDENVNSGGSGYTYGQITIHNAMK